MLLSCRACGHLPAPPWYRPDGPSCRHVKCGQRASGHAIRRSCTTRRCGCHGPANAPARHWPLPAGKSAQRQPGSSSTMWAWGPDSSPPALRASWPGHPRWQTCPYRPSSAGITTGSRLQASVGNAEPSALQAPFACVSSSGPAVRHSLGRPGRRGNWACTRWTSAGGAQHPQGFRAGFAAPGVAARPAPPVQSRRRAANPDSRQSTGRWPKRAPEQTIAAWFQARNRRGCAGRTLTSALLMRRRPRGMHDQAPLSSTPWPRRLHAIAADHAPGRAAHRDPGRPHRGRKTLLGKALRPAPAARPSRCSSTSGRLDRGQQLAAACPPAGTFRPAAGDATRLMPMPITGVAIDTKTGGFKSGCPPSLRPSAQPEVVGPFEGQPWMQRFQAGATPTASDSPDQSRGASGNLSEKASMPRRVRMPVTPMRPRPAVWRSATSSTVQSPGAARRISSVLVESISGRISTLKPGRRCHGLPIGFARPNGAGSWLPAEEPGARRPGAKRSFIFMPRVWAQQVPGSGVPHQQGVLGLELLV